MLPVELFHVNLSGRSIDQETIKEFFGRNGSNKSLREIRCQDPDQSLIYRVQNFDTDVHVFTILGLLVESTF